MIKVRDSLARSFYETAILQDLHTRSWNLKQTTRGFNYFLTAVMEGYMKPGSENFANFLIERMRDLPHISKENAKVIDLYIQLLYGNPHAPRVIPFFFAQACGLFRSEVALLTESAEKKTRQERQKFAEKFIKNEWDSFNKHLNSYYVEKKEKIEVSSLPHRQRYLHNPPRFLNEDVFLNAEWKHSEWREFYIIWLPDTIYLLFVWLLAYPQLWDIVSPYTTAQFVSGSKWKKLVNSIDKLIFRICWSLEPGFKNGKGGCGRSEGSNYVQGNPIVFSNCYNCRYPEDYHANCTNYVLYMEEYTKNYEYYVNKKVVDKLKKFLRDYKEGAFVILALMYTAHRGWRGDNGLLPIPDIEGKDPIEVLHVIKKLNDFMRSNLNYDVLINYFEEAKELSSFEKWKYHHSIGSYVKESKEDFLHNLLEYGRFTLEAGKIEMPDETQEYVRFLKTTVTNRWKWFAEHYKEAANQWTRADDLTRSYYLTRACYIAYNNLDTPSNTPTLERTLITLLKDTEARLVEEKQREKDAELMKKRREQEQNEREKIEKDCAWKIAQISYSPPDTFTSRALKDTEIEELKKACLNKLDLNAKATLMVIDDFVNFCTLLSKPENHVKKPSGQYIEKEVPLRTVADMVNEMRGELTDLPNYTAYAKITQGENGNQRVAKIKTFKLRNVWPADERIASQIKQEILAQTYEDYCHKRETIEEKIRQKQRAWQKDLSEKPIPGREGDIKPEKPVKNEEASPPLPTRQH